jgi:hypothetical protein
VDFEAELHAFARTSHKTVLDAINAKPEYNDEVVASLKNVLEAFKKTGTYASGTAAEQAPSEKGAAKPASEKSAKASSEKSDKKSDKAQSKS